VTGSRYLLEAGRERLMIDCGLFQGEKELRLRNWSPFPLDPSTIQWLVLTHAHLDHTGYIPRFINEGFRGQILATQATVDLAHLLLPDSGHLQEEDTAYANKKHFSKHEPALALYSYQEAVKSLEFFRAVDDSKPVEVSSHFALRFFPAGHILGARSIAVTVRENATARTVLFSGDIGRYHQLIIREPVVPDAADILLVESTYGDRLHPAGDFRARLSSIAESTAARGGSVVIPAFAVGRTQELLYLFRELIAQGRMHSLPIYVDSPMAIDTTDLYRHHREDYNVEADKLVGEGIRLFSPPDVHFARSVEESKALNDSRFPTIIISASGMATGGRVLHHLARCLPDNRNTILFVGFQAAGTRGQIIQSGARTVKMYGEEVPIRARIESMESLSGHADSGEILRWLGQLPKAPNKTFLVHGEPRAAQALRLKITQQLHWEASAAAYLQKVSL
jgi:metallo-beta-lactamase family protein